MEEPDSGVICYDAERDRVHGGHLHGVPAHGVRLALHKRGVQTRVVRRIVLRAVHELHLVSVEMANVHS